MQDDRVLFMGLIKRRDRPSVQYTPQRDSPSMQYTPRRDCTSMQYTPQRDPKKSYLVIVCIVFKSSLDQSKVNVVPSLGIVGRT